MAETGQSKGGGRFAIRRQIGAGGFGVVYDALDRELDRPVALKTLRRFSPAALYRFKQEFRSLADIAHPNLVTLYDLLSDGDEWFFTMELVDGVPFLEYVRNAAGAAGATSLSTQVTIEQTVEVEPSDPSMNVGLARHAGRLDEARLRRTLAQVAEAILAIHDAGIVHRDIKPQNVLVTPEGRAVLLDFGLVSDLHHSIDEPCALFGTPAYMAPEQAAGHRETDAADWYAFGVMLYEALVGERPFKGDTRQLLAAKQRDDPLSPAMLAPDLPADLTALCMELLRRKPADRPSGPDIQRRLALDGAPVQERRIHRRDRAPFIGRERHLQELAAAFETARQTRPVIAYVRGRSGMGKSALLQRFLSDAKAIAPATVVVVGRCYEHESVPFKALDSLIDALTQHLKTLTPDRLRELLPRDVHALARLFPVIRELPAVTAAPPIADIADSGELRRRAFGAFRELVSALARREPVIFSIDDLQWGDLDSGTLLAEIVRPPYPPALLLIGSYRSEEVDTSVFLRSVPPMLAAAGSAEIREIDVGELSPDDATALAIALSDARDEPSIARARAIAAEAEGSPFFIDEMVRYAAEGGGAVQLSEVIDARVRQLPEDARHLLEVVTLAGQPVDLRVAIAAAQLTTDARQIEQLLDVRRLARQRAGARQMLEPYHDRIRESVVAALAPDEARAFHGRLAEAWEAAGTADPEVLANHYEAAEQQPRAAHFARIAAAQADEALAFDRAAQLYGRVLDLQPHAGDERRALLVMQATALANAGRGEQAADAFLAGVEGAGADEALDLERNAAEALLRIGKIEEGLAVMEKVLARVGLTFKSPAASVMSIVARQFWLKVRGTSFRERPASAIRPETLRRIDVCWSASNSLHLVDSVRAADFHKQGLLLSLRAGEPNRVARTLAVESSNICTPGGVDLLPLSHKYRDRALALGVQEGNVFIAGLTAACQGIGYRLLGLHPQSLAIIEEAEKILSEQCTGAHLELMNSRIFELENLFWLGEWPRVFARAADYLKQSLDRGDVHLPTYIRTRVMPIQHLADDRPDVAHAAAADGIARWPGRGFNLQHIHALHAHLRADLYTGDVESARRRLADSWKPMTRSMLLRIQTMWVETYYLRAAVSVTAAAAGDRRSLADAERDAKRLERSRAGWAMALARTIQAAVAAGHGDRQQALLLVAQAEGLAAGEGLAIVAAACRRRRGELLGAGEGAAFVAAADVDVQTRSVVNPLRIADVWAPGQWTMP